MRPLKWAFCLTRYTVYHVKESSVPLEWATALHGMNGMKLINFNLVIPNFPVNTHYISKGFLFFFFLMRQSANSKKYSFFPKFIGLFLSHRNIFAELRTSPPVFSGCVLQKMKNGTGRVTAGPGWDLLLCNWKWKIWAYFMFKWT